MTSIKKLAQFVGLGLTAMVLAACGGGGGSSGGTGLMSLAVTDAPIDEGATRVVVRFTHIELKPREGDRVVICLNGEEAYVGESSQGRASCDTTGVREIDLLALQGEESEFLFEDLEIPAGEYSWIRFYLEPEPGASSPPLSNFLTSSYIEFEGPRKVNLIIPGGLQAGLQLVSGFTVPVGGSASFTVDFDLRNMIQPTDEFGGSYYRMRRALRLVDNSNVGAISGAIDVLSYPELSGVAATCTQDGDLCPGLSVFVYNPGDEEQLTSANVHYRVLDSLGGEYRYTAAFLTEGLYDLKLTYEVDDDVLDVLDQADDIGVVAGETTEVDFPQTTE